jgi:hypothetical protein
VWKGRSRTPHLLVHDWLHQYARQHALHVVHNRRMVESTNLHDILEGVAAQMIADFSSSRAVEHRASKGTVREETVRAFLANYLPRTTTVTGSGELMAADGGRSGQCDVMVLDASTPPLWEREHYRIAPIECCYATIEVKSRLDSSELRKSWDAAVRLKSLPRTAYLPELIPIQRMAYGRAVPAIPPQVHVFAYEGVSLETLGAELTRLAGQEEDHALGIDSVCVLDRGMLVWATLPAGNFGMRQTDSQVASYSASPGDVLLWLTSILNAHLATAVANPRFDILKYVTKSLGELGHLWAPPREVAAMTQRGPGRRPA